MASEVNYAKANSPTNSQTSIVAAFLIFAALTGSCLKKEPDTYPTKEPDASPTKELDVSPAKEPDQAQGPWQDMMAARKAALATLPGYAEFPENATT